ncbi:bone morphogenetic protein 2 isoform X2 [Ornithorhynchus anatinus]|nr:bone morphogenetic protein 2 isoform X2 [Ornithorhynchus anatinus]
MAAAAAGSGLLSEMEGVNGDGATIPQPQVLVAAARLSRLPLARVKALVKADPDVTLAGQEAIFVLARATELFVETIAKDAYIYAQQGKRKTLQRKDLDNAIEAVDEFAFLEAPSDELHFHFVLSAMAPSEQILSAQLHLFRLPGSPVPPTQRGSLCQVSVFQVLEEEEEELATVAGSESGARLRLLAVRLVPVHGTGWEVFPITEAVRAWTERAASNRGLLVTLQSPGGTALEPRPLRFASGHLHHHSKRPMLVLFTDNSRRAPPPIFPQFPASMFPGLIPGPNHTRLARSLSPFRPCQRLPLYVDFEEIGWMGWIISPHGYNAYQCRGSCPFPLGQNMQPTNHATVQSIISALRLVPAVSSPCCVPRQLASISLLYFDEAENVVLKHYEGMVARECGCH